MIQVREHRKINQAQRLIATGRLSPTDKLLPDQGGHHHAPGAQPHVDRVAQRRQEVGQAGVPHPVGQIHRVAAIDQQHVGLLDGRDPMLLFNAGQRGEFQHAQRLPPQFAHGAFGFVAADEPPSHARAVGEGVAGGGDTEGVALGNRFAQQVEQRVIDAGVFDAGGCEQKFHNSFPR